MRKKIITAVVFSIGLLVLFFLYQYFRYQYIITLPADADDTSEIAFVIKDWRNVAHDLFERELIVDADVFLQYMKNEQLDRKIKAGVFYIKKSMTIPEIAKTITSDESTEIAVTIPEGYTIVEIDQKLAEMGLIQKNDFIKATQQYDDVYEKYSFLDKKTHKSLVHPLEGFLFPDTYFVEKNSFKSEKMIDQILSNFEKKITNLNFKSSQDIFEVITMASILEKEALYPKDLPIISGILWKRLDVGMQLGADATLLYLKSDRTIDYQDLQEDSDYNTRKKMGLPPGPIGNPGLSALQAALSPEDSPYFYYLSKPENGEMVYSKTNDEHNQNKAKYLN